jgi:hypothetical protein
MESIAACSQIDAILGEMLVMFLKGDRNVGLAMYGALTSTAAQMAALKEAARVAHASDSDAVQVFEAGMRTIKRSKRQRDKFAHHIWGVLGNTEHCLVLFDPRDHWADKADMAARLDDPGQPARDFAERAFLYTLDELKRIAEDARDDLRITHLVKDFLDPRRVGERKRQLDLLKGSPRFRDEFQKGTDRNSQ